VKSVADSIHSDSAAFIARVGENVRALRSYQGLSRRQLADRSGVSQRHLAELERGDGNMSLLLLHKVAVALDEPMERLLAQGSTGSMQAIALARQFDTATAEQQQQVQRILQPCDEPTERAQRVALIGLRGAGKSTLGRLAGERLSVPFVELNDEIELASGMSVHETIALYGQEGYRLLERQVIERMRDRPDKVIFAVAGGIVSELETYALLLRHYHTVWIKAQPEEHLNRVRAQGDERPMAGNPAALDELRAILTRREARYAQAQAVVDTTGTTREQSVCKLVNTIVDHGFLVDLD